jgi:hypothetical protein
MSAVPIITELRLPSLGFEKVAMNTPLAWRRSWIFRRPGKRPENGGGRSLHQRDRAW